MGETAAVPADDGGTVVVVGLGEEKEITAETVRKAGAAFVRAAWHDERAALAVVDALPASLDRGEAARALVEGVALAAYQFTKYKSESKPCRLTSVTIVSGNAAAQAGISKGARIAEAVALARDLVNEPAGAMTPTRLAEVATEIAERNGLGLTVYDEVAIHNEGFGGLEGVARGSAEPPRLLELVYEPPGAAATVAIVGKGITFDSGGLSLKPADGMEQMKTDMSGAAAVLATMSALADVGVGVKVVGIVPSTENMPGGRAIKPGDVLKIRNGKTVDGMPIITATASTPPQCAGPAAAWSAGTTSTASRRTGPTASRACGR